MIEADIAFHSAIYAASGNPLIGESAVPHWVHLRRVMGAVLQQSPPARGDLGRARGDRRGDRRAATPTAPPASSTTTGASASENLLDAARRRPRPPPPERPAMKLTPEQLAQFDRDGYLFFPGLFSPRR